MGLNTSLLDSVNQALANAIKQRRADMGFTPNGAPTGFGQPQQSAAADSTADSQPQTGVSASVPGMGTPQATTPGLVATTGGGPQPSATSAPTTTPAPPATPATANYGGYAAPGYTTARGANAPSGWEQDKWRNAGHQSPKYVVGGILDKYPRTPDGIQAALAEIQKAYPGTTFDGKDKLNIPGVDNVDVLKGASMGGEAWQWGVIDPNGDGRRGPVTSATGRMLPAGAANTAVGMAGQTALQQALRPGQAQVDNFDPKNASRQLQQILAMLQTKGVQ